MKISVLCNSGRRGEEIPCAFHLGGRRLPVVSVLNRWSELPHRYFEVSVDDGRRFVLRHDAAARCWELAAVYAASRPALKPPAPPALARLPGPRWRWFGR